MPIEQLIKSSTQNTKGRNNSTGSYDGILKNLVSFIRKSFKSIPVIISNVESKNKSISIRVFPLSQDLVSQSSSSRLYEYSFEIVLYYTIANPNEGDYKNYLNYSDKIENVLFFHRTSEEWFDGVVSNITVNSGDSTNLDVLTTRFSFNCKHSIN